MKTAKSIGQIEAKLTIAIVRFEKECLGRGPMVSEITEANIISLHTNLSSKTGERIVVLTTGIDLEAQFS
jgi:uncharacterized protein YbcI